MALAKLMYLRSRQSKEGKETGYNRVMSFVTQYHDLQGLKATMKQMMRIAGLRAFALEVSLLVLLVICVLVQTIANAMSKVMQEWMDSYTIDHAANSCSFHISLSLSLSLVTCWFYSSTDGSQMLVSRLSTSRSLISASKSSVC